MHVNVKTQMSYAVS